MQKRNASDLDGLPLNYFTVDRGHEYDRKPRPRCRKLAPKLDTGNATKMNIENQAACLAYGGPLKECLGRRVSLRNESVCIQ